MPYHGRNKLDAETLARFTIPQEEFAVMYYCICVFFDGKPEYLQTQLGWGPCFGALESAREFATLEEALQYRNTYLSDFRVVAYPSFMMPLSHKN